MKLLPMAMFLLIALFIVSSATHMTTSAASWRTEDEVNAMYESWLIKHGKSYNTLGEKENRFQIFKDNLRYIEEHNSGNHSYKLGLNQFSDLTNDEFRLGYTKRKTNKVTSDRYSLLSGDDLPDSVDWRSKGAVADVKNQQQCESSWAFSAIGAVEGINQIVTGDLITLSDQELMDCDKSSGNSNDGCSGGLMTDAFKFIINNGGIHTEDNYPYNAENSIYCHSTEINGQIVSIDGYEDVPVDNELALQKAVANQPIAAAIEIEEFELQTYAGGIYDGPCESSVNAAVVVVGYGTEDGKDYWLMKNSWGASWGEEGYIRLERNVKEKTGKCGIATLASYPIKNGQNPPNAIRRRTQHLI